MTSRKRTKKRTNKNVPPSKVAKTTESSDTSTARNKRASTKGVLKQTLLNPDSFLPTPKTPIDGNNDRTVPRSDSPSSPPVVFNTDNSEYIDYDRYEQAHLAQQVPYGPHSDRNLNLNVDSAKVVQQEYEDEMLSLPSSSPHPYSSPDDITSLPSPKFAVDYSNKGKERSVPAKDSLDVSSWSTGESASTSSTMAVRSSTISQKYRSHHFVPHSLVTPDG